MAISLVQTGTTSFNGNTGTENGTLPLNTTAGNTLIMAVGNNGGTGSFGTVVKSINDTQGNVWQFAKSTGNNNVRGIDIWYASNIGGGSFIGTVIQNCPTNAGLAFIVREYSGLTNINVYDVGGTLRAASGTAINTGTTPTTSFGSELVFAAAVNNNGTATYDVNYAHGTSTASVGCHIYAEDLITSTTGQQVGTFNGNVSDAWAGIIATFRDASAAGLPSSPTNYRSLMGVGY